MYLSHSKT